MVCILLLSGCGKKEDDQTVFDASYYTIATPYKKGVGSYSLSSYDKEEVESMLMELSMEYFKTNNSHYQEGQYLEITELKELLSTDKLNNFNDIEVDNVTISPKFITAIYEQNYLAVNGNLKGISLALVLNPNQSYDSENSTLYKRIDEETVLKQSLKKASELLEYLRSKAELKDVRIMMALYLENNSLPGTYKYIGVTTNNSIKFDHVDYHYEYLDGKYVVDNDVKNYNNFKSLKDITSEFTNTYMTGYGLYKGSNLVKIKLVVNTEYLNRSQLLYLSNNIGLNLGPFSANVGIKTYIKSNNKSKVLIIREQMSNEVKIYLLEE